MFIAMDELIEKLAIVFAKNHDDIPENCDTKKMKKILLDKCEECKFLVLIYQKILLDIS